MTTPATPTMPSKTTRSPLGHVLGLILSLYVAVVFAVLWAGIAIGFATGGGFLIDVWTWLTALQPIAALVAWVLILPIGVGAWAMEAGLEPLVTGLVVVGLVAWTLAAVSGLVRAFRPR
jgi:hypothetical protein